MKKKLCLIFSFIFILSMILQSAILAAEITPRNNNTALTTTGFYISDSGQAAVDVYYSGYPDITTGATITIKIEKRNLLVFWNEVVFDTITVNEEYYFNTFYYQLEKSGTYRCTVVYTVSGSGGADDVITYEGKDSF